MSYDETNPTLLRFSTSDLPQRDRLPFWREIFARKIVHVDIEPAADFSLQAAASLLEWPGLRTIWATSSPARMVRKVPMLADGDDSLGLIIKRRGQMVMAQSRVELALGARGASCRARHVGTVRGRLGRPVRSPRCPCSIRNRYRTEDDDPDFARQ